jgi:hypothetical protein
MNKPNRPSFATAAVAEIAGPTTKPVNPDEALWPNAGTIKPAAPVLADYKDDKDSKASKDVKPEKITFSNKLEATTYLKLQQLATYGGENIQEILEAALTAYFADKEEASRPLPPKALATLRRKYPFL